MSASHRRLGLGVRAAAGCAALVAALTAPATASSSADIRPAALAPPTITELGPLEQSDRGNSAFVRDGGMSGPIGDRLLWLFGDAISPNFGLVDNSAAVGPALPVASGTDITQTDEETDAEGDPVPFIPMTESERNPPEGDRFALWSGNRLVPTADGSGDAWLFFHKLQIPWDFTSHDWWTSTGVARVHAPDARHPYPYVTRDNPVACNPECLFTAQIDPHQFNASAQVDRKGYLYLVATERIEYTNPLYAARAPFDALDRLLTHGGTVEQIRGQFRFWDGSSTTDSAAWVPDISAAAPMEGFNDAWAGHHSISWNPHLGAYLGAYLGWDRVLKLRTAPTPVGPWSEPVAAYDTADTCPDTGELNLYSGWEHPHLATDGGRRIVLSYFCGDSSEQVPAQIFLIEAILN